MADSLSIPHPEARFDFAISIAVIHHLSTPERRVAAIKELLASLKNPHGKDGLDTPGPAKALVYVWALEQKTSRRGWDEGHEQDVMVPWVLKSKQTKDVEHRFGHAGQGTKSQWR